MFKILDSLLKSSKVRRVSIKYLNPHAMHMDAIYFIYRLYCTKKVTAFFMLKTERRYKTLTEIGRDNENSASSGFLKQNTYLISAYRACGKVSGYFLSLPWEVTDIADAGTEFLIFLVTSPLRLIKTTFLTSINIFKI